MEHLNFVPQTDPVSISCMLDDFSYTTKPGPLEMKKLSVRLGKATATVSRTQFIEKVGERGQTFLPCVVAGKRNTEHWRGASLFPMDFDGGLSHTDFRVQCDEIGIYPLFCYETLSSTNRNRFRAVFLCTHFITDEPLWNLMKEIFKKAFPQADSSCWDPVHVFLGGKAVIDHDGAEFAPHELLFNYKEHIKKTKKKNSARHFQKLIKKTQLNPAAGKFGVSAFPYLSNFSSEMDLEYEEVGNHHYYIERSFPIASFLVEKSHNTYIVFHWKNQSESIAEQHDMKTPKRNCGQPHGATRSKHRLTPKEIEYLKNSCQLCMDFWSGRRRVSHTLRFLLASNLFQWQNGHIFYQKGIHARADYRPDDEIWRSVVRYEYKPAGCDKCPYAEQCNHPANIVGLLRRRHKHIYRVGWWESHVTLSAARERLASELGRCFNAQGPGVTVIRAETGVGKTELLLNMNLQGVCLAFPTHALAAEAYERFRAGQPPQRAEAVLWPKRPKLPSPFRERIRRNDAIGQSSAAVFREALNDPEVAENDELGDEIRAYLKAHNDIHTASTVFCTHERALYLDNPNINHMVFDEDMLHCAIRVHSCSNDDVCKLLAALRRHGADAQASQALEAVVTAPQDVLNPGVGLRVSPGERRKLADAVPKGVSANPLSLLQADYFISSCDTNNGRNTITSVTKRLPPSRYTTTILSATADDNMYRQLFGPDCAMVKIPRVKPHGRIILHPEKSYSKSAINHNVEDIMTKLRQEYSRGRFTEVISHKALAEQLVGQQGMPVIAGHFHAVAGTDKLKGKQIGVLGTPFRRCTDVLLIATALGIPCNMADIRHDWYEINQTEFTFRAYLCSPKKELQEVELALIQGELEQAAGRARTLHHPVDVHVYSGFPVPGAVLESEVGEE